MPPSLVLSDPPAARQRSGASILVIAVSNRLDSDTRKLARLAEETARGMWVDATLVDSGDYPLPLCECDLDADKAAPANALRLNQIIHAHQGMIIVMPERNRSIPAVLKNALDWLASAAVNPETPLPFRNKPVLLMSASDQEVGCFHGLNHLRDVLIGLNMHVLPDVLTLNDAAKAFGKAGKIRGPALRDRVSALVEELIVLTERLHP